MLTCNKAQKLWTNKPISKDMYIMSYVKDQGRIQDLKLGGGGGAHLRKLRQTEGGALKKIAPNGGRRENCWGISCEKSRFYAKKIIFFPILGGPAPGAPPLKTVEAVF